MLNAPINPIDLSAGADLRALLQLLIDPAATKVRLDELVAQETATKEQIDILNNMAAETRRLHQTAAATNIVSENRKAALDAREAQLDARETDLTEAESSRSAASLQRRENAVQAREASARAELERLSAMRTDLEGRLAKIKSLTATLER